MRKLRTVTIAAATAVLAAACAPQSPGLRPGGQTLAHTGYSVGTVERHVLARTDFLVVPPRGWAAEPIGAEQDWGVDASSWNGLLDPIIEQRRTGVRFCRQGETEGARRCFEIRSFALDPAVVGAPHGLKMLLRARVASMRREAVLQTGSGQPLRLVAVHGRIDSMVLGGHRFASILYVPKAYPNVTFRQGGRLLLLERGPVLVVAWLPEATVGPGSAEWRTLRSLRVRNVAGR